MEQGFDPSEVIDLAEQRPHLRLRSADSPPPHFTPLRLVLQPSGAAIDADRTEMLVGRHTDSDIRLPLPDVSRRHCRLYFLDGRWQVTDLNSLNGVHVNGEQVQQTILANGDALKIGGFTFTVELPRGDQASAVGHVQSILKTLAIPPQRKAS